MTARYTCLFGNGASSLKRESRTRKGHGPYAALVGDEFRDGNGDALADLAGDGSVFDLPLHLALAVWLDEGENNQIERNQQQRQHGCAARRR